MGSDPASLDGGVARSGRGAVRLARPAVLPLVIGIVVLAAVGTALGLRGATDASAGADASAFATALEPVPAVAATAGTTQDAEPSVVVDDHVSTFVTADGLNIDVYSAPDGDVQQTVRSDQVLTVPGATPLVLLVTDGGDETPGWYQVYLPVRPNGTTGWVRASDVTVGTTDFWIEVSISGFTMTVYDGTEAVLTTPIGVGRDDRPTPGGVYYLKELLRVPDASGPYGPYAYGLSGYQSTLDSFHGGEAVIGIHGTNDPTSFGRVVSSGCIRVPNATIAELAEQIGPPLGTPVYITD
ncbi:L,D-transpeptidase [Demequina capsici]|uniref:L,D-transpeptidase n=1 Tax=Demequina capsici TaxID=3075620 RepID=A0AA96FAW5_9MICO|nr:L,D-transpeptidase [Demequina sp. OYTSA14]WNM24890.1 L,D-transpeptidase [Demequina sp. OYTSA14]